jgi:acyl-coenzyme A thioesterase 9
LDALAGAIAYKHIGNGDPDASPVTIVTASVDRLDLYLPKANIVDYKLSGHVTYVGNSSMEGIYIYRKKKKKLFIISVFFKN